ncbi:MAG: pseudouridine synthase [Oscillospiraceae bacterium]|nr:pseudouridine synthase [Oscillospiraceae bacterium]
MRLDRFLSAQTTLSRKEAQTAIRRGEVTVNETVQRKPDLNVDPDEDHISLGRKPISYQKNHYFLMHKPAGVLTACSDRRQKTVLNLLAEEHRLPGLFPSGRLDIDTTGMLLITDDGMLSHKMLAPKSHVAKYYLATLRDPIQNYYADAFADGITLETHGEPEPCMPADFAAITDHIALIALHEGKYHQVKRMFAALGNHVEKLARVQIGALALPDDLQASEYTVISEADVQKMFEEMPFSEVSTSFQQKLRHNR